MTTTATFEESSSSSSPPDVDRDLELKLFNNYHLKGVRLTALENEERIAILGITY